MKQEFMTFVRDIDQLCEKWRQRPVLAGVTAVPPTAFTPLWLEQLFPPRFRQTRFLLADYQWICLLALVLTFPVGISNLTPLICLNKHYLSNTLVGIYFSRQWGRRACH